MQWEPLWHTCQILHDNPCGSVMTLCSCLHSFQKGLKLSFDLESERAILGSQNQTKNHNHTNYSQNQIDNEEFENWPLDTYIELLCGESPNAHSCGVSFRYPIHISNICRRNAKSSTNPSHSAVRWGNKGIGTWEDTTNICSQATCCLCLCCVLQRNSIRV